MVQNVYPLLKSAGRDDDAKAIFDTAFEEANQRLVMFRNDATDLNDLAWLCALAEVAQPGQVVQVGRVIAEHDQSLVGFFKRGVEDRLGVVIAAGGFEQRVDVLHHVRIERSGFHHVIEMPLSRRPGRRRALAKMRGARTG